MKGAEFIRKIRWLGRKRRVAVQLDKQRGKGSHARLHYGERTTTIKYRKKEISPGLLHAMLQQLGLKKDDLD
jgi:predicted RNA binding protein YcfA (HicA-like mRNA interferase family)